MTAYDDARDKVIAHLRHLKEHGVTRVPVRPETLAALRAPRPKAAPASPAPTPLAADATSGLQEIAARVAACKKCRLAPTRTRTVPGQGNPQPEILFVGEGPGEEEDRQGLAFVGAAGQLLTRMIMRMGFTRDEVFIANIVKCRPPDNRKPAPDEMAICLPYLREQIALLRPRVIVALGATAVTGLTGVEKPGITRLRGTWMEFAGVPLMPTFHPSYLLRSGGDEKARYWEVWEDLKQVLERLGRTAG